MKSPSFQINQSGQGYPNVIKKSKFIASVAPVNSEKEAKVFIEKIQKQNHKANHNCWAYRIYSPKGILLNESDDGEPSGSAGKPILFILEKQNIVNTVVVITRYFGGIKLGKGGLVRSYGKTTNEIIKAIGVRHFNSDLID